MDANFAASLGQYAYDSWRNFVLLEEIPLVEKVFMKWMIALWIQILLLLTVLGVGFFMLYKQSKKVHDEVLNLSRNKSPERLQESSKDELYIPGLHELMASYHRHVVLKFREVRH